MILDEVNSPADLKKLSVAELPKLAGEIRKLIQEVVARTGGHLASNLGVVELTLALHYVYDFRQDRLVWDVGHQCYTHKILTGRKDDFQRLRQYGGLSGFPSPAESDYDAFFAGHSGTSISTALGLVCAHALVNCEARKPSRVVAVIGDGSIGTGMAFEALNHAGVLKKRLLVILNDNRMSIAHTMGALSNYLNRIRVAPIYNELKKDLKHFLDALPVVGEPMEKALEHIKSSIRHALVPGRIFEDLGFRYFGPLDGHDLPGLIEALREIDKLHLEEPVLLHVYAQKGRGFGPAVLDPSGFHSASPFHMENGKVQVEMKPGRSSTYTDVVGGAMVKLAAGNPRLCVITAAMPLGVGALNFAEQFPGRYFDVGICEQHAVGLAAGLAAGGQRPVVAIYSTFLQRAYDQIFHDVCLQQLPIVFAIDRAGLVGADGPTHHGMYDIAYLRHLPGMMLMAPKDGRELEDMLAFALDFGAPIALRYPRAEVPGRIGSSSTPIVLGKAEVLTRGGDGAVLAYGAMVAPCYQACAKLQEKGIMVTLVNARFAKPLDEELIAELLEAQPFVVTVEDGVLAGGFGSAVAELALRLGKDARKLRSLGVSDRFIEHGPRERLLQDLKLDAESLVRFIEREVSQGRKGGTDLASTIRIGSETESL